MGETGYLQSATENFLEIIQCNPHPNNRISKPPLFPFLYPSRRYRGTQLHKAHIPCRVLRYRQAIRKSPSDGTICIQRETKKHKGKIVTAIYGFDLEDVDLKKVASDLKNRCGAGGSVKDGVIVTQRDHRDTVMQVHTKKGYTVKLAGG